MLIKLYPNNQQPKPPLKAYGRFLLIIGIQENQQSGLGGSSEWNLVIIEYGDIESTNHRFSKTGSGVSL